MNISLLNKKIKDIDVLVEVVILKSTNHLEKNEKELLDNIFFTKKSFNTYFNSLENRLYISCLKLKKENIKIAFYKAVQFLKNTKIESFKINILQNEKELNIQDIVEGLIFGNYEFNSYKSSKSKKDFQVFISIEKSKEEEKKLQKLLNKTLIICNSVDFTKDIVNSSPEDYYPQIMANDAMKIALNENVECKVFDESYLKQDSMNAMFSVGKASRHESKLIHLSYKPKNPIAKIVLVGKGVTYDTGGLSLKRESGMVSMKCDKAGAASVMGIIHALSSLDLPFEVHGIIGAVENMIGGNAYKPDDVLTAKNGKTIEVRNTDAEGRLVLSDCLCYAQDEIKNIDYIFDFATLTGACVVGVGEYTTGIMGNNNELKREVVNSALASGEYATALDFNRFLKKAIKSEIADVCNIANTRYGGAITAGMFLDNFIYEENKNKWIHFDIAGPAFVEKVWGYNPHGASGAGVRMAIGFLQNISK